MLRASKLLRATRTPISFIEVGPRDGLQNEKVVLTVDDKAKMIRKLVDAGVKHIEAGSLVNYKRVPQMMDSDKVVESLADLPTDVTLSLLVPHHSFVKRLPSNTKEIVLFLSASDTFNQKNINTDLQGAFQRYTDVMEALKEQGRREQVKVRGSISCCWGCPYEGDVAADRIKKIMDMYMDLGVNSIDICDTIGVATPKTTQDLLNELGHPFLPLSLHMHDTNGEAVDNIMVAANYGIKSFQGSVGGIGGCPFSPKRAGNVDSTKVIERLHSEGFDTGIDLEKLKEVREWTQRTLNMYTDLYLNVVAAMEDATH